MLAHCADCVHFSQARRACTYMHGSTLHACTLHRSMHMCTFPEHFARMYTIENHGPACACHFGSHFGCLDTFLFGDAMVAIDEENHLLLDRPVHARQIVLLPLRKC